jgi:hypothetical protein
MNSKREERAIDALLVSQLRSNRECIESLPELTDLEREALNSLGYDFMDRLIAGYIKSSVPAESNCHEEIACGPAFGMNRAKDLDEVTRQELDRKRQEIIERIKQIESAGYSNASDDL